MRVLVLLTRDVQVCREAWHGIDQYRRAHANVDLQVAKVFEAGSIVGFDASAVLFVQPTVSAQAVKHIRTQNFRGPIGAVTFWDAPPPNVDVACSVADNPFGPLAFEHFQDYGYRACAFLSLWSNFASASARARALQREAEAHGVPFDSFIVPHGSSPMWLGAVEWLRGLPTRCGVLLADDSHGPWMNGLMHRAGRSAPEDLGLLGTENDQVLCEGSHPTLSSIRIPAAAMGETAMHLLAASLRRSPTSALRETFEPLWVEPRVSTDESAVDHPQLREVLRFIRGHADEALTVQQISDAVKWNRRAMELAFRTWLTITPLQYVHRCRIDRAKKLMAKPELTLGRIAESSGFKTFPHFSRIFKRQTGVSPGRFRHLAYLPPCASDYAKQ